MGPDVATSATLQPKIPAIGTTLFFINDCVRVLADRARFGADHCLISFLVFSLQAYLSLVAIQISHVFSTPGCSTGLYVSIEIAKFQIASGAL